MLLLPTKGVSRTVSADADNVKLDALCDWIEGSVLFCQSEISKIGVVEILREGAIYESQDRAIRKVEDAWTEIRRRLSCIGNGVPISVSDEWITPTVRWRDAPGYCFCLALSFSMWYPDWANQFGPDYTEQGTLFEDLTRESLTVQLTDWKIHPTGWSRTNHLKLKEIVAQVASVLGEAEGEVHKWTSESANDGGLDLLCFRPFQDGRVGIPVYLMQCASGRSGSRDWYAKLKTPDLDVWTKIIQFASAPQRAFATPHAFLDKKFFRVANLVQGLLIDRCRLLRAGSMNQNWVSRGLSTRLITWLKSRIKEMPGISKSL